MSRRDSLVSYGLDLPVPGVRLRSVPVILWLLGFCLGRKLAFEALEPLEGYRMPLAVGVAATLWTAFGAKPLRMMRRYLYAQPHVRVEIRNDARRVPAALSALSVGVLLVCAGFARKRWGSDTFELVVPGGIALLLIQLPASRLFVRSCVLALSYPRVINPGVFNPLDKKRWWYFASLALVLSMSVAAHELARGSDLSSSGVALLSLVIAGLGYMPACHVLCSIARELGRLPGANGPLDLEVLHGRLQEAVDSTCDSVPFNEGDFLLLGRRMGEFHDRQPPMLLPIAHLTRHFYASGSPGSGKTNLLAGMVMQLLRRGRHREDRPAVFVIDMKGDRVFAQSLSLEAERGGYPFRHFALDTDRGARRWNPLEQFGWNARDGAQVRSQLMSVLGADHGAGHGPTFFSGQSRAVLKRATTNDDGSLKIEALENFTALHRAMKVADPKGNTELAGTLEELADYVQLHTEKSWAVESINIDRALDESHVTYAWLEPVSDGVGGVRAVSRMLLHAILDEASKRAHAGKTQRQCYVIMDEFQVALADGLGLYLEQARSYGVSLLLANQSIAALRTAKADLIPLVKANTGTKAIFSIDDAATQADMVALSGEVVMSDGRVQPKLTPNDVAHVARRSGAFLLTINGSDSPVLPPERYLAGNIIYPCSKAEYMRREQLALAPSGVTYPEPAVQRHEAPVNGAKQPRARLVAANAARVWTPANTEPATVSPGPDPRLVDLASRIRDSLGSNQVGSTSGGRQP